MANEERPADEPRATGEPRIPEGWSEEFGMGPLEKPTEIPVVEHSRRWVLIALMLYLIAWGGASVWVLVEIPDRLSSFTNLIVIFVAPILPLVGIVVNHYFSARRKR
jgi:cytochrome bd-type quinol oxidase subunit 2